MWAEESVIYQIYPLGMCGAPYENDGVQAHRILEVKEWIPHLTKLGITAVYFCPVFESDTHGPGRSVQPCRPRILAVPGCPHKKMGIPLQGLVQYQLRRKFPLQRRPLVRGLGGQLRPGQAQSQKRGSLVKLNLRNEEVIAHIFDAIRYWVDYFDIDGLRLDVAYCLDRDFIRRLRGYTDSLKDNFYLIGEILGGDYKTVMGEGKLHSATNYECYKGLFSSFNSMNMFEIVHSLMRQFGSDPWCLYRGYHLLSFVDNHDVTRVASVLTNKKHLERRDRVIRP